MRNLFALSPSLKLARALRLNDVAPINQKGAAVAFCEMRSGAQTRADADNSLDANRSHATDFVNAAACPPSSPLPPLPSPNAAAINAPLTPLFHEQVNAFSKTAATHANRLYAATLALACARARASAFASARRAEIFLLFCFVFSCFYVKENVRRCSLNAQLEFSRFCAENGGTERRRCCRLEKGYMRVNFGVDERVTNSIVEQIVRAP